MVSFSDLEEDPLDDSMSLAASDTEEWTGPTEDTAPLPSLEPIDTRAGMDGNLFRVLSRAVEQHGLHRSPPEEPTHSRLDKWYLPGRQRAAPFFLEVHDELT